MSNTFRNSPDYPAPVKMEKLPGSSHCYVGTITTNERWIRPVFSTEHEEKVLPTRRPRKGTPRKMKRRG